MPSQQETITVDELHRLQGTTFDPPARPGAADPIKAVEDELAGRLPEQKRRNKWGNKPTWVDSPTVGLRRFDSKKEANRARELDLLVAGGKVTAWWHQWPIWCGFDDEKGTPVRMYPDFRIMWADGQVTFEDTKGAAPTSDWKLKARAVRDLHGIEVQIV